MFLSCSNVLAIRERRIYFLAKCNPDIGTPRELKPKIWRGGGGVLTGEEYVKELRANLDRVFGWGNELVEEYIVRLFSGGKVRGWLGIWWDIAFSTIESTKP
jgi:hypothetical protein